MPRIRYKVTLSREEREELEGIATRGKHRSQKVLNALILLGCDQGPHQELCQLVSVKSPERVGRVEVILCSPRRG